MRRHVKASFAGSNEGNGSSRGLFRRALLTRGACSGSAGTGVPSRRPARNLLALLALAICAAAITAAPASAAGTAPETKVGTISNVSYTSAHLSGHLRANSFLTFWYFQYSTDGVEWLGGPFGPASGILLGTTDEVVEHDITGLKGGSKYYVRLAARSSFLGADSFSPEPNPSFTTLPVDPPSVLSIDNASNVAYTTATAKGKITRPANTDPAFDVTCNFEYLTDEAFTNNPVGGKFNGAAVIPCEGEAPIHAPGSPDVGAHLTGLTGATTYHLRLSASNGGGTDAKEAASTFTTKAIPKPSVVTIDNASTVAYTTAHLSGKVQRPGGADIDPGLDAICNFEYISDKAFNENPSGEEFNGATPVGCEPEGTVHAEGSSDVSANLTGLTHNTTYHLRLSASNAAGTDAKVAASTFTTKTITKPSVVTIDNASAVDFFSAHLSGKVQRPGGADTDPALDAICNFEYISDKAFNENPSGEEFNGATPVGCEPEGTVHAEGSSDVSANLTGLPPATEFHLRLSASNAAGTDSKVAASTFTTKTIPKPAVLRTDNASDVGYSVAKLTGKVERPAGADSFLDTKCTFEYIPDANFGNANEVIKLRIAANGGVFSFYFRAPGHENDPRPQIAEFPFDTPPATIQAALEGFEGIGAGNVIVTGGPGNEKGTNPYVITFTGALANKNVPNLGIEGGGLIPMGSFQAEGTQGHAEGFEDAGQAACKPEGTIHAAGGTEVEAQIGGLLLATKYRVRLTASNQGGTVFKDAVATFTTLGPVVDKPSVSIDPVTTFSDTTAEFKGKVNPNGTDPVFNSAWHFQCTPSCGEPAGGVDAGPEQAVSAAASGLEPNTAYQVKLLASNPAGKSESTFQSFKTAPSPPSPHTGYASEVQASSATISGQVNPRNSAVTYQFEWGLNQSYGNLAPADPAELGEVDNFFHPVSEPLTGLSVGTVYHFRLAATNTETDVTVYDADHTFETPGAPACSNQQLRVENGSTALPDCRAYEMVSPVNKSGNDAGFVGSRQYAYSTADGNRVMYATRGATEGATRGLQFFAVAHREADRNRWSSRSALPAGTTQTLDAIARSTVEHLLSADLSKIAWRARGPWVAEASTAGYYLGDIETGKVDWLTPPPPGEDHLVKKPVFNSVGASPDLSTIYFQTNTLLFPNEEDRYKNGLLAEEEEPNRTKYGPGFEVFEYSGGVVKPAGTLPDGERPAGGSIGANIPNDDGDTLFQGNAETLRNQVSRDGSTLFLVSPDPNLSKTLSEPPQLYIRRNGQSTLVSHDAAGKAAPSGVSRAVGPQYVYGSPDGNLAIFQSRDVLAPGAPNDSSLKAYRYDVATDTVSFLPGLGGTSIVASSDDGQRFLFYGSYIGVWDHGAISVIAKVAPKFLAQGISPARATSDGSNFVFLAAGIAGFNASTDQVGGSYASAAYRYDLDSDVLDCISCPPEGIAPEDASLGPAEGGEGKGSVPNPIISEDADRIFFDTVAPLVSRDTNGVSDAYEWTPSGVYLISSGKSPDGSYIHANSASGNDAFFSTTEGIDPRDTDGIYDLYDARVGGGFPQKPAVTPCTGNDICHEAPGQPPSQSGGPGTPGNKHSDTPKFSVVLGKVVGGSLRLQIKAPEAATVAASGKGLRTTRGTYSKPGSYKLAVPLKPSAKGALRKGRKLKLEVHLRFSPRSGALSSADLQLTVKG